MKHIEQVYVSMHTGLDEKGNCNECGRGANVPYCGIREDCPHNVSEPRALTDEQILDEFERRAMSLRDAAGTPTLDGVRVIEGVRALLRADAPPSEPKAPTAEKMVNRAREHGMDLGNNPVAYEFYNAATGHAIVDYTRWTHVGHLTDTAGYEARPLVYASDPKALTLTDEQWEELRRIARTYNEKGFPKYALEFFARAASSESEAK